MTDIRIDFKNTSGKIKHMNSVNNGPFRSVRNRNKGKYTEIKEINI